MRSRRIARPRSRCERRDTVGSPDDEAQEGLRGRPAMGMFTVVTLDQFGRGPDAKKEIHAHRPLFEA